MLEHTEIVHPLKKVVRPSSYSLRVTVTTYQKPYLIIHCSVYFLINSGIKLCSTLCYRTTYVKYQKSVSIITWITDFKIHRKYVGSTKSFFRPWCDPILLTIKSFLVGKHLIQKVDESEDRGSETPRFEFDGFRFLCRLRFNFLCRLYSLLQRDGVVTPVSRPYP